MKKRTPIQLTPRWLYATVAVASLLFCSKAPAPVCSPHITVTNTNDNGLGSLRDALAGVCAGGIIDFDTNGLFATPQTISILGTNFNPLIVNRSVNIVGPGADRLTISGNDISRVFSIAFVTSNSFSGFTISGGSVHFSTGGGIYLQGASLLINACALNDNYAGGGSDGGAIASISSSLVVSNSTLSDNTSDFGAGIHVLGGTCHIINSTISGNLATNGNGFPGFGGGIAVDAPGVLTVDNSTISGNSAVRGGGIFFANSAAVDSAEGIDGPTGANLSAINNSIVDGNTAPIDPEVASGLPVNANYSLFGNPTSPFVGFNNLFGLPIGSVLHTNLAYNGGPTVTLALLPGGPAVNAGDPGVTNAPPFDQRGSGFPRIIGGRIDIGAFEFSSNRPPVAVCTNVVVSADTSNCTANASIDGGSYDPDTNDVITITQIPPGPYPSGTNTVTLFVVDSHGASNECTGVVTVIGCVANHSPVAVCTNVVVSADASNCTANASIDGGSYDPDTNDVITVTQIPPGPYPIGSNNVCLIVTDSHGASNACCSVVTVVDDTPPTLSCPTNITQTNDPGQCSAVVSFVVSASDCAILDLSCDIPSGTAFPVGTNYVTCTAVDVALNTNTCTFAVIVQDTEPPQVTCRPAPNPSGKKIPVSGKNPSSGQNPDGYYQVLAKDNCDPNPQIYIHDLGSSFVAGPFNSGDIVKLKQNPGGTPTSAPGNPPIVAEIHLNGDAEAFAVDSSGNQSLNGCYMYIPPAPK